MNSPAPTIIYADANATSRMRPEVASWVTELLADNRFPGNASSVHRAGQYSRRLLRTARSSLLSLMNSGRTPADQTVVFTSGATEGANLVVRGLLGGSTNAHIICSSVEHPAILEPVKALAAHGCQATFVDPNPRGAEFNFDGFLEGVTGNTKLVALMLANNETGRVYPVAELSRRLRTFGYLGAIVTDATQALSKVSFDADELFTAGVDAIVVSSHKIGGPTGVGAVVLAKNSNRCWIIEPQQLGGNQESGFRGGTENVVGISAFGIAAECVRTDLAERLSERAALRERLWTNISALWPNAVRITPIESEITPILCNTLLVSFPECRGDDLVVALDLKGVCCSTGAACASGKQSVSHVLTELALADEVLKGTVRFSLDWDATEETVQLLSEHVHDVKSSWTGASKTETHASA